MGHPRSRLSACVRALVAVAAVSVGACGDAGPQEQIGTTSAASTFVNDQPAFEYFVGKGLTPVQAAGIVGNLDQESGVDPTAEQPGGPGRGIAQWSVGGRWDTSTDDNATWYATKEGKALLSLSLQLDFIWYELTTYSDYGLAALQAATTVSGATIAFEESFEGCGSCDQSARIAYAENVLAAFGAADGGALPDAAVASGADANDDADGLACTVTTTGESGQCMDVTACAALGHQSTPGFCPGPESIECCTSSGEDGGGGDGGASDGGAPPGPDGGTPPPIKHDAGTVATKADAGGAHAGVVDAAISIGDADRARGSTGEGDDPSSAGGCSLPGREAPRSHWLDGAWLAGLAGFAARRRRRIA